MPRWTTRTPSGPSTPPSPIAKPSQAAIADYEVQLKYAEIALRRTQELHDAQVQSQDALDIARTNVDSLKAKIALAKDQVEASATRIQQAQQNVDNCVIRAPFSGIIVSKDAQVGEMVSPLSAGGGFTRTGIATIVDMNSNEIEVDVNEAYIARVQPGPESHGHARCLSRLADSLVMCAPSSPPPTARRPPSKYASLSTSLIREFFPTWA